ncbi:MAG: DsrE family protein [Gammaproteobacteria bacterium]|nr:DsrE family protein [Gammaproteobacteria bacterium]
MKAILTCVLFWLVASSLANATEAPRYKLILQVSEDSVDKLNLALNNAKNAQNAFGPENIEIEIVVFGGGIQTLKYYTPTPVAEKVRQATYSGVRVVACENALRASKLRPSDLLREVRYVPSGVAEIVEKASQGWVYISP